MAKVVSPLHSTAARGKMAGLIYNSWRGFATVKAFASPTNPQTEAQLLIRALLTQYTQSWKTLTSGQREGWITYAADHLKTDWTGTPMRITGANWYIACNIISELSEGGDINDPPTSNAPGPLLNSTATGGAGDIDLTWFDNSDEATHAEFWIVGPHSAGRNPTIVQAKRVTSNAIAAEAYTISGLVPGLYTVFLRAVDNTSGLVSGFKLMTATAT